MSSLLAEKLYFAVRTRATARKARLLMVACCRLLTDQFFDPRIARVLAAAERCADDPEAEAAVQARWDEVTAGARSRVVGSCPDGEVARAVSAACALVSEYPDEFDIGERYSSARAALASAVLTPIRDQPLEVFNGGAGDAVYYCLRAIVGGGPLLSVGAAPATGSERVEALLAGVVGDIFGHPTDRIRLDTAWRTKTAVTLARQQYESRDFSLMPILGDALADAGCPDGEVLEHCRGPNNHVRGCHVVDLVLAKT
jgi:hypothetical protein